MSKYLVTGGAGFIGSCVAQTLVDDGHEVVIIDNLSTGFRAAVPDGAELIVGHCQDVSVYDGLRNQSFEAIYHIAAQSSGEISFDDPVYDLQSNAQSTLLLLKLARQDGGTERAAKWLRVACLRKPWPSSLARRYHTVWPLARRAASIWALSLAGTRGSFAPCTMSSGLN